MSEFLAEARILIRPDTTRFRAELQEQVNRAISQTRVNPLEVPVSLGTAGLIAASTASQQLAIAQQQTTQSTLGLASAAQVENSEFGKQAVILKATTAATQQKAGADISATNAARSHAAAQSQVGKAAIASTAGMLGLRGAVLTAGGAFIAATVGFQALGKAIGSAISFEKELNVFAVTAGATAEQMERVQQVARDLGRDITLPGVAANDAAQALSLLARAGLSVENSIEAVRGTLQLATAAEIENADAVTLVANALNSFKLDGTQATRVADLLAGAANESQGSITDMGLALKQVSAIASGLGISLEDTVTILTQLSRAGLSSSDAGTSFRQTLLRLIQDLPKVSTEVARLGLDLRDVNGNIRPEVFEELGRKLKQLTPEARQLAIANLGGADAIRTLLTLTRAAAGEFDAVGEAISKAGLAQELAAAQTEGLGGDVEAARNEFAELGLTVGNLVSGPLSLFVRTAGEAAGAANDLADAARKADQGLGETLGNTFNRFEQSFARLNFQFRQGVQLAVSTNDNYTVLARTAGSVTSALDGLADALQRVSEELASTQGTPQDEGLGVQQILNRVEGLDAAEVRARISGDTNTLLQVLEQQQAFLIAQLNRQFVKNRPALRRALEQALLGTTNDIAAISQQAATDTRRAATDLAQAQRAADQALLDALSNRREDAERRAAAAAQTASLSDDIRAQDRIQALIKAQIAKIRAQVRDERTRKEAIRELRQALIDSRREEDELRQQRAEEAAARRAEAINLDIDFAETIGNVDREIAARLRLIALLKKQQAAVKKGTNEWKRLRNEIAEQQQAIKDARGQAEQGQNEGNRAAEFFFEQLQAQQGFAANLLGNLIPRDATAGLVGLPSPAAPTIPNLGAVIGATAGAAQGRSMSAPTSGQVSTTNDILLRILAVLNNLNNSASAPEAVYQKKMGAASMTGGGGNVEVM